MTNELQKYDTLSKEEIMRLTGQEDDSGSGGIILPKLALNRVGEDDEGNKLEVGTYTVYDSGTDQKVYSKKENGPVKLRPFKFIGFLSWSLILKDIKLSVLL